MQMTKKILSVVLAVMMVVSMMAVMGVTANAAGEVAEIVTVGEGGTGAAGDQFATVNEAVAAAGEGGEVKLIADIYIPAGELNVGIDGDYTTTLNLNGHNITSEAGSCITLYSKYPGGKTFTIKGSGTVSCTPKYTGDACISDSSGRKVVIKGGTYTNTVAGKNALYVSSDEGWTISGGTYNGNIMVKSDLTMTAGTVNGNIIQDGKPDYSTPYPWTNTPSDITISGGTVNGEIVENADNNNNIVVTGGTFANDPGTYVDTSVYKVKYTNTAGKVSYKTNIDYSNVGSSGTYQLLDDITAGSRIVPALFASNVVFDLNGHTLTSVATDQAFRFSRDGSASSHKSFTITDTSTNGGGKIVANNLSASVSSNMVVDVAGKYTDVTISNVTIESPACGVAMFGDSDSVTITNSTIKSTDSFALATNGADTKNGTITVTNSTLTSTNSVGVYLPGDADATFNNATVSGTTAMYVKGGTVDINGGSYTATGAAADYTYNGNGCNPTGDAIVVENAGSSYTAGPADVTIANGTTFASANNNALAAYTKNDNDAVEVALDNVTVPTAYGDANATFTFANGAAVTNADTPVGYELQDNGDGSATVVYAPLNPLMKAAASINDGNHFGLNCDYLMGSLLGVQKKDYVDEADITSDSHQETGADLRFVAVLSTDIINAADIDDYGFVLGTVNNDRTTASVANNIGNLKAYGSNGEKTVSCLGTSNNVCGSVAYGDPSDTSTDYKYVTCAVNGLVEGGKKVVARFYVKKGGKVYYAKYAQENYAYGYTGAVAGINASGAVY